MADLTVRRGGSGSVQHGREWDPFQRMQELMGWDPFEEMRGLLAQRGGAPGFVPAFEVKETKDAYVFRADVPGLEEKDLEITLTGDRLSVSGKREAEKRDASERFYAYERSYGTFSRSFTLPEGVEADKVQAELKNGVLSLTLPKRPETQPRRIQVGGGGSKTHA